VLTSFATKPRYAEAMFGRASERASDGAWAFDPKKVKETLRYIVLETLLQCGALFFITAEVARRRRVAAQHLKMTLKNKENKMKTS